MTKKLYIETVGCQMNVLDSELVVGSLRRQGYFHFRQELLSFDFRKGHGLPTGDKLSACVFAISEAE